MATTYTIAEDPPCSQAKYGIFFVRGKCDATLADKEIAMFSYAVPGVSSSHGLSEYHNRATALAHAQTLIYALSEVKDVVA